MGSLQPPDDAPSGAENGPPVKSLKRKAPGALTATPPARVRIRTEPTGVKAQEDNFWDKMHTPLPSSKEEVRRKLLHATERWDQLKKYKLIYEYSAIKDTEIRLIYINPATKRENDLIVSIKTIADHDIGPYPLQEYEALSYHWGPGPADNPVYLLNPESLPKIDFADLVRLKMLVPDYLKGQRCYVRPNLDKALRYLRDKTEMVVLWVDAICINQNDEKGEKPKQIAKMKHIYNKATNVCVWLGDGKSIGKSDGKDDRSKDFNRAMAFIKEIIDLKKLEKLSQDIRQTKRWSDLLDLMRCSWFSRRWVIQELALARMATVHCGGDCVSWQDFADAIGFFALKFQKIRELFRQSNDDKIFRNYRNFNELEPLGAKVLVDAITNTFRKSVDGSTFEPVWDLETLVSKLSTFESSDPRDTIYALLNISRESLLPDTGNENTVGPPKPNYERDLLEVYTDFLEWVVYKTKSIDIICRQWAIPERERRGGWKNPTQLVLLPSWVQTISKSTWGTQLQSFNGRINGDSIVGKAGRRRYNASHWREPVVKFGLRPLRQLVNSAPPSFRANSATTLTQEIIDGPGGKINLCHKLHIRGIEIDRVAWAVGPISRGVITKECLEKGGWKRDGKPISKLPDKLWRTLVADRDAEGENPPPWYHRAAIHCMALADNNGHIGTCELLDQETSPVHGLPQLVVEYLKRIQAVTWNRKFIEGTVVDSEPLFGLGPPETEVNDRICILFGCSVPCILRPYKSMNGTQYFQFLGEAYVYGRMDGEAITLLRADELQDKTIDFVIV